MIVADGGKMIVSQIVGCSQISQFHRFGKTLFGIERPMAKV
jgi:hypothetical protein